MEHKPIYRGVHPELLHDLEVVTWLAYDGDREEQASHLPPRQYNLYRLLSVYATPRQKEVLCLYYHKHLNQVEIARRLRLTAGTVSRTIEQGMRHVRVAEDLNQHR